MFKPSSLNLKILFVLSFIAFRAQADLSDGCHSYVEYMHQFEKQLNHPAVIISRIIPDYVGGYSHPKTLTPNLPIYRLPQNSVATAITVTAKFPISYFDALGVYLQPNIASPSVDLINKQLTAMAASSRTDPVGVACILVQGFDKHQAAPNVGGPTGYYQLKVDALSYRAGTP